MHSWTHHEYYIPFLPIYQKTQYKLDSKMYVSEVKTSGIYIIVSYNNNQSQNVLKNDQGQMSRMLCTL